ncbi:hypothetical protein [Flavobacterium commune]|uniref:Alkyl hydroperoxide reductase subunit C/ Thiol specific antioxidant domain-containing protein n=1 Tax=Flavobacterium commune TaxID=1306519 RepID=A0A1D9PDY8_9FLAO|nr:hypothetical protein [Flavobacterium commune]APA00346.1 hypothetical protein BIW12_13430 [Flavobacterium commune]
MKKINYIIILILIVLNSVLAYKIKSNTTEFRTIYSLLNKKLDKNKSAVIKFEHNFIREQKNENLQLDSNFELLDILGNKVFAKDILKKNSLVFRFSELNCGDCIDAEINALINNKDKIKKNVILISYYQNPRNLFVFYNEFQKKGLVNFEMYLSPAKGLGIPLDQQNIPYYFCVNSNLIMNNFFIPQKEKPKLSQVYLECTSKNFLN